MSREFACNVSAVGVEIVEPLPAHRGLGSGTQLALAVAAGTRALLGLPPASADELAAVAGRGRRSGVGVHGFLQGGLIWETGHAAGETVGRLNARLELPDDWRVLLISPRGLQGLSGSEECAAFAELPPASEAAVARLTEIAERQVLPAARAADFTSFSAGVYEYGRESGMLFAPVQGGAYASELIAERVAVLRRLGAVGVGQSSWGPTVFALCKSDKGARLLRARLSDETPFQACDFTVAAFANNGACVEEIGDWLPGHSMNGVAPARGERIPGP